MTQDINCRYNFVYRSRQSCSCCKLCAEFTKDFEKVADLKGLIIYRPATDTGDKSYITVGQNDAERKGKYSFVLQNTKDEKLTSAEYLLELEQTTSICCEKCQQILEQALKLLQRVSSVDRNTVHGICDHCWLKEQSCVECQNTVKKFIDSQDDNRDKIKENMNAWLSKVRKVLKDSKENPCTIQYKGFGPRAECVKACSEPSIDEICLKDTKPIRKLDIKDLFQPIKHALETRFPLSSKDDLSIFLQKVGDIFELNAEFYGETLSDEQELGQKTMKQHRVVIKEAPPVPFHSQEDFSTSRRFNYMDDDKITRKSNLTRANREKFRSKSEERVPRTRERDDILPLYLTHHENEKDNKEPDEHIFKEKVEAQDEQYQQGQDTTKLEKTYVEQKKVEKVLGRRASLGKDDVRQLISDMDQSPVDEKFKREPVFIKKSQSQDSGLIKFYGSKNFSFLFPNEIPNDLKNVKSHKGSAELIKDMLDAKAEEEEKKRLVLEEKEKAAEKKRLEAEKKRLDEEKKRRDEEKKRRDEEKKIRDEEKKRLSLQKKIHDREAKRCEEEKKKLEEDKKIHDEEIKRLSTQKKIHEGKKLDEENKMKTIGREGKTIDKTKEQKEKSSPKQKLITESKEKSGLLQKSNEKQNDSEKKRYETEKEQREAKEKHQAEKEMIKKEQAGKLKQEKEVKEETNEEGRPEDREERDKLKKEKDEKARLEKESKVKDKEEKEKQKNENEEKKRKEMEEKDREEKERQKKDKEEQMRQAKEAKEKEKEEKRKEKEEQERLKKEKEEKMNQEKDAKLKEKELGKNAKEDPAQKETSQKQKDNSKKEEKKNVKEEENKSKKEDRKGNEINDSPKSKHQVKEKQCKVENSLDDLILQLVRIKKNQPTEKLREALKNKKATDIMTEEEIQSHKNKHDHCKNVGCPMCVCSDLELQYDEENRKREYKETAADIIIGEKIFKYKPSLIKKFDETDDKKEILLSSIQEEEISEIPPPPPVAATKRTKTAGDQDDKGVIRYALSDRTFIEKGWTMLPTEKIVRKMNVYRMRPAHPEFDWFKHNKNKRLMHYDTGERLAEFDDNGRGRWYYRNGRLALNYYDTTEINAQQRFVIYSNGEPDERNRHRPYTILATFDYLGNGIVFDHTGKIRLKYNQTEGVILDRSLGPVSHWKWHSLNDPPVLQQVMIDTQMPHKDPAILNMPGAHDKTPKSDNEDMLAIEFDNFIKEKSKKLTQSFKPFQIKMKALKINEHFSLKVLDQASVYLIYRDGTTNLKLNIGMVLDHKEIVDTDTAELGEVSNNMEKFPAITDSLAELQKGVALAQRFGRVRAEHERRLRRPEPTASADKLAAAASRPMRVPLRTVPSGSATTATTNAYCKCSRKPKPNNVYYNNN